MPKGRQKEQKDVVRVVSQDRINPYLKDLHPDFLYHFGLDTTMDLGAMFSDVKFVCTGGSALRAKVFAKKLAEALGLKIKKIAAIGKTERFSLYKVGPVISVSHGIGMPSMLVVLNEITKLLWYAQCGQVEYIRIGTSGGVGVEPGTVVVAIVGFNGKLRPVFERVELGRVYEYPTVFNHRLGMDILKCGQLSVPDVTTILGMTMGTDDFYEGQGRLDGALKPRYDKKEQMAFLKRAYDAGVINIEMEAPAFAAFCNRAKIPAADVCVTLLDRLRGDQVTSSAEELAEFSDNAQRVVISYLKQQIEAGT